MMRNASPAMTWAQTLAGRWVQTVAYLRNHRKADKAGGQGRPLKLGMLGREMGPDK